MKSTNHSFCFLIPTRNRVETLNKVIHIITEKTFNLKNIEVILGIDSDDYSSLNFDLSNYRDKGLKISKKVIDRKFGYEDQPERLKEMIKNSEKDFFIHFADDMIIETNNWDLILQEEINNLPQDLIYLLYPSHNQDNVEWPLCQIISKKWISATKKFTNYFETDTELLIISSILGRKFKMDKFKIQHYFNKIHDKTYLEGRGKILKENYNKKSILSISSLFKIFIDTEKLHEKINLRSRNNFFRVLKVMIMFIPRIFYIKNNYNLNYVKVFFKNLLYLKL